jgi:uncharacterized membrane protein
MIIVLLVAFLMGVISGLRAMTAPAVVSWAAWTGTLPLLDSPLQFMGYAYTPYLFSALALLEIFNDKRPATPSRKSPPQFLVRIFSGCLVGACIGASAQALWPGLIAGAGGAIIGTVDGASVRVKLANAFRRDLPAALVEDVVAISLGIVVVSRFA